MVNPERLTERNFTWVCDQDGKSYYDLIHALTTDEVKLLQESCRMYPILLDGLTSMETKAKNYEYGANSDQVLADVNQLIIRLAGATNNE